MHAATVELRGLCVDTESGRPLVRDLSLSLGHDRVALVGRNGVGKSTLLRILAGEAAAASGSLISRVSPVLVRQDPAPEEVQRAIRWSIEALADPALARVLVRDMTELGLAPLPDLLAGRPSRGEARKLLLLAAKHAGAELLLLDEPTEGLDEAGIIWLGRWLRRWGRAAIVVTHHRGLLRCFEDFFVVAESGCRHVSGGFAALERRLADEGEARERQYVRNLGALDEQERRHEQIGRRRERKKNVGRLHELDRCTSRMRLNAKRGHAQVTQARAAKIREDRIAAVRGWTRATRRALTVTLPLELHGPTLADSDGADIVTLDGVGVDVAGRALFSGIDLRVQRQRVAVTGPNGSGKSTLLRVMLGERRPTTGSASRLSPRIGHIDQGATAWISDDSLMVRLLACSQASTLAEVAALLVAHKFPLALAERPLRSLSPGERVRAALICLFQRAPTVELLVLDEPSDGLDLVGLAALERALRAWPGGLVVASHDRELLANIGATQHIALGSLRRDV